MMNTEIMSNFTTDEWKELQQIIKKNCTCEQLRRKRKTGLCGACKLKKDDRTLSYLVYWHRRKDQLLAGEGVDKEAPVLV